MKSKITPLNNSVYDSVRHSLYNSVGNSVRDSHSKGFGMI